MVNKRERPQWAAQYAEAGNMVRLCDTTSANAVSYAIAIYAASPGARAAAWVTDQVFAIVVFVVSLVFFVFVSRIRINHENYFQVMVELEKEVGITRKGPHWQNEEKLASRPKALSISMSYKTIFVLGMIASAALLLWSLCYPTDTALKVREGRDSLITIELK
jgi:hypothetical protein